MSNDFGMDFRGLEDEVPVGRQEVLITKATVMHGSKDNPSGKSVGLKLELTIVDGKFKNYKISPYINVRDKKGKPNDIGDKAINKICKQCGMKSNEELNSKGVDCLVGKKLSIAVKEGEYNGTPQANVSSWAALKNAPKPATKKETEELLDDEIPTEF